MKYTTAPSRAQVMSVETTLNAEDSPYRLSVNAVLYASLTTSDLLNASTMV